MVKRNRIILNMHYIAIPMMCGSVYERLTFYAFNGSVAYCGGAIEMHLMDSRLGTSEIDQFYALNNSIAMIMVVYVEMDLMKLPL